MPFVAQTPRPLTRQQALMLSPGQFGVYGLFKSGVWVYVGRGDIRQRLLDHINGDNPMIATQRPTHWVSEVIRGDAAARERTLIRELNPASNQKIG